MLFQLCFETFEICSIWPNIYPLVLPSTLSCVKAPSTTRIRKRSKSYVVVEAVKLILSSPKFTWLLRTRAAPISQLHLLPGSMTIWTGSEFPNVVKSIRQPAASFAQHIDQVRFSVGLFFGVNKPFN